MFIPFGFFSKEIEDSTPTINNGGSILFKGNRNSFINYNSNDPDFSMGTSDFTIEWFQYQTDSNSFPRIFQLGNYPSTSMGVSIEGGIFYFWANSSFNSFGSDVHYKNTWVHFAITRQGTTLRAFKNGIQFGENRILSANINNTVNNFTISNESTRSDGAAFGGNITNFRWIKGDAIYTSNFNKPTSPLESTRNTKLLLLATDSNTLSTDSSTSNKIANTSNISWSSLTPFS